MLNHFILGYINKMWTHKVNKHIKYKHQQWQKHLVYLCTDRYVALNDINSVFINLQEPHAARRLPQSAPWLVSVSAAFWQSGKCPPPLRNASSPGQYSGWWRHLSARRQHYGHEGKHFEIVHNVFFHMLHPDAAAAHLQWTAIGPSWPNCSLVLCTWPMKSMKPSPDLGTPCSGQSVNWNWRTVRDWPSWRRQW